MAKSASEFKEEVEQAIADFTAKHSAVEAARSDYEQAAAQLDEIVESGTEAEYIAAVASVAYKKAKMDKLTAELPEAAFTAEQAAEYNRAMAAAFASGACDSYKEIIKQLETVRDTLTTVGADNREYELVYALVKENTVEYLGVDNEFKGEFVGGLNIQHVIGIIANLTRYCENH